jgi:hypothetical protein
MRPRHRPRLPPLNDREIDARYGLEPVFEPGTDEAATADETATAREGTLFRCIQCPYCGEAFDTLVDPSAGSARYVEDCQICCQPIEMILEVDDDAPARLSAQRGD